MRGLRFLSAYLWPVHITTYVGQTINRGVRQIVKYRSPKPSDLEQKETLKAYGVSKTLYNGVVEARLGILVPRWKIRGYV